MESNKQTDKHHWKSLRDNKYVGAHDLKQGQELRLTIERVEKEDVTNKDGSKAMPIIYFKGAKKPMVVNATNARIISKLHDSVFVEDWVGKEVIIYGAWIKAFGSRELALRIKNTLS